MSDEQLMRQAVFALSFAPKSERDPELEKALQELDSTENLNYNPMALRCNGLKAARFAYVMGAKWGMAQINSTQNTLKGKAEK